MLIFWHKLPRAITDIDRQGLARVIVVSSTGEHFSAGMDLAVFTTLNSILMADDPARMVENLRLLLNPYGQ